MLRLRSLTMTNFGPYYGRQTIEIKSDNGVVFVWGENGFGKTSILNAFRYVLWDEILSRTRRVVPSYKYVNLRSVEENENMSVEAILESNGRTYTINRGLIRIGGAGNSEKDYRATFNMLQDGRALPQENAIEILSSILPKEISRFYLFDGELMAEYEKLLDPENTDGERIKHSIEDLLGMPILINGRVFLEEQAESYRSAASKIAGRNTKCAGWVSQNETNRLILAKLRETKSKLEKDRDDLLGEKRDITSEMSKNQKLIGYLKSKDTLESTLKDQIKSLAEIEEQLQPEVDGSWKSLLADVAKSQAELLEKEYQDLSQAESNTSYSKMVLQLLKENESKCQCPTCRNTLSVSSYQELIRLYERSIGEKDRNFDRIIPLRNNISKLHQISATNNKKLVSELLHVVNNKKRDILFTKGKIKDEELRISSEGKDANTVETELLALPGRLSDIEKKITLNHGAIENNENDIRQKKKAIEDLDRKIASEGAGEEFEVAQARAELVESLQSLFEESITIFRNELTRNVEQDASEFFASITNQPEQYDHLEINDNFGLEIIHKEGMAVPNRSGGEEQIVAFSLINALHKNAPIDGPIFMDSTFQRIDKGHQTKSAGSLLTFNTQIIIFVYEDEIKNIDEAYRLIGDRLIREYKISKVGGDTFKSKIE